MAGKIRVGLIGASLDPARSWGTRAHIPALRHLPDFELSAICTSRRETAEAAAAHFGVPLAFHDARQMAEHPDVDVVVIAVRTREHKELFEAVVAAHKHVYCEWPLGMTTDEARQMQVEAEAAGIVNMIGLQASGNEMLTCIRDLIRDGFVGRVVSVNLLVSEAFYGPFQTSELAYVADIRNGTNLLHTATPHSLEALSYCIGNFRELTASISVQHPQVTLTDSGEVIPKTSPDQVMVQGVLEPGAVVSVHVKGGASRTCGIYFEINGSEGDLIANSHGYANIQRADLSLQGGRDPGKDMQPMPLPDKYRLQPPGLPQGPALSVAHHYGHLAKAVRDGVPVPFDFGYAVRRHEVIDAIRRSAETGQRQTL